MHYVSPMAKMNATNIILLELLDKYTLKTTELPIHAVKMGCSLAWKSLLYINISMATTGTPPQSPWCFFGACKWTLEFTRHIWVCYNHTEFRQSLPMIPDALYSTSIYLNLSLKFLDSPSCLCSPHWLVILLSFRTTFWVCQFLVSNWSNWTSSGCIAKAIDVATANRLYSLLFVHAHSTYKPASCCLRLAVSKYDVWGPS